MLHYLAKILLETDARLLLFSEDMTRLEAAARCTCIYRNFKWGLS